MLLLQKFLRGNGTLTELTEKYALKVTRDKTHQNLVLLKYSQIASPFTEEIVREARGIILDEADNWNVVSFPYVKFGNTPEGYADKLDWSNVTVQEKLDGSLTVLHPYKGQWRVQTSGVPDASGEINGFDFTFAELFWKTFRAMGADLPPVDCGKCFMFELMTPYNKVVVQHKESKLAVIGGRDLQSLLEMTATEAGSYFPAIPTVREFPLTNLEEIANSFQFMDPTIQEGYVCVNYTHKGHSFPRVKEKAPQYTVLHQLKGGLASPRAFVEICLQGEIAETVIALPEYKDLLFKIKSNIELLVEELNADYVRLQDIPVQKDFALEALKTRCSGALFQLRAGRVKTVQEFLRNMNIDNVTELVYPKGMSVLSPVVEE